MVGLLSDECVAKMKAVHWRVALTHLGRLPRWRKVTLIQGWVVRAGERVIGHVSGQHRGKGVKVLSREMWSSQGR